ncbi:uncharacterized protein [Canis lupus baileyi]|uniref:uncharacterized protein n=1 Tax=Canis lupus baileyi TaxID=143281 RepID=UPI003B97BF71
MLPSGPRPQTQTQTPTGGPRSQAPAGGDAGRAGRAGPPEGRQGRRRRGRPTGAGRRAGGGTVTPGAQERPRGRGPRRDGPAPQRAPSHAAAATPRAARSPALALASGRRGCCRRGACCCACRCRARGCRRRRRRSGTPGSGAFGAFAPAPTFTTPRAGERRPREVGIGINNKRPAELGGLAGRHTSTSTEPCCGGGRRTLLTRGSCRTRRRLPLAGLRRPEREALLGS